MNGFENVKQRIKSAAEKAGRNPDEIKLVVVSKTRTIEDIMNIYNQGQRCFAENRVQEALAKIPLLPNDIEWHLIGNLQTNKAKQAVSNFSMIQSLESIKLAEVIQKYAEQENKIIDCLLEIKISFEETKSGIDIADVKKDFEEISAMKNICISGLMGMAPFTGDIDDVRESFGILKKLFDELKSLNTGTEMKWLSMGMSGDFETAIKQGANMLRIGTAVFEN